MCTSRGKGEWDTLSSPPVVPIHSIDRMTPGTSQRLRRQFRHVAYAGLLVVGTAAVSLAESPGAASLRGSAASLDQQNRQAERHDFTYLQKSEQLRRFVDAGLLVPIRGSRAYRLKDVSFPYARPEVRLFIERLGTQYHRACGEQLVVTSLTRPLANQPRNASPRSVHPTGMALDLRRPTNRACRDWLESTLLYLEERAVIEATRERGPPHYHIAVFPQDYAVYVERTAARNDSGIGQAPSGTSYTVRRTDTLWRIARRHKTTVDLIRQVNQLRSAVIHPGQVLRIPASLSAN